ncbi:CENP-C_C domain-containing protein [Trichonephila clavata]|nr:CENP-C_C domain-containing protein [Trichonephila clavata]GFQ80600.1 CENP-C_C domain-containing protein [Trichonephila clavata]
MEERKRKHLSEIKESAWSKRLRPETSTDEDEEDISVFLPDTRNSREWSNATYSGSVKNLRRVTPKPVSGSANGLRRSTRIRVPPLETWRNERLVFKTLATGEVQCMGIDRGTKPDTSGLEQMEKKSNRIQLQKARAAQRRKSVEPLYTHVRNGNTGRLVPVAVHRPFEKFEWRAPTNVDGPPPFHYKKTFVSASRSMCFGFLEFSPLCSKESERSSTHNTHFCVMKGHLEATIEERKLLFTVGDSFIVPSGVSYTITNLSQSKTLLSYCLFSGPFFDYQ